MIKNKVVANEVMSVQELRILLARATVSPKLGHLLPR